MNVPLPTPKPQIDWIRAVNAYPVYANDVKGDCAIAAIGHMVQWWTALIGKPQTPDLSEILRVYSILSPNDDGCILTDVLNYWMKNPICEITIPAYVSVNPLDEAEFQVCMEIFGGLYTGVELPILAQSQNVWDYDPAMANDPRASYGSWGGHCVPFGAYHPIQAPIDWLADHAKMSLGKKAAKINPRVLRAHKLLAGVPTKPQTNVAYACITWGEEKTATAAWKNQYMSEAYAIVSPDWVGLNGKTPEGIDEGVLKDYLASIH